MQRPDGTTRQFLQRVICLVLGHEVVYKETILILDSQSPVSVIKKPSRIRCTTHGGVAGPLSKYSFSLEIVVIETHHEDKVTEVCCELIEIHAILVYCYTWARLQSLGRAPSRGDICKSESLQSSLRLSLATCVMTVDCESHRYLSFTFAF